MTSKFLLALFILSASHSIAIAQIYNKNDPNDPRAIVERRAAAFAAQQKAEKAKPDQQEALRAIIEAAARGVANSRAKAAEERKQQEASLRQDQSPTQTQSVPEATSSAVSQPQAPTAKVYLKNQTRQPIKVRVHRYFDSSSIEHKTDWEWPLEPGAEIYPGLSDVKHLEASRIDYAIKTDDGEMNFESRFQGTAGENLNVIVERSMLPVSAQTVARNQRKPWLVLLIGGIVLASIVWQVRLFQNDKKLTTWPKRLVIPSWFSGAVVLGFLVFGIFALNDSRNRTYSGSDLGETLAKAVVFSICLLGKSYLAPLFAGGLLSYSIYCFAEFGQFESIPAFGNLLDWVFEGVPFPELVQAAYLIVTCLYAFGASFHDVFEHASQS